MQMTLCAVLRVVTYAYTHLYLYAGKIVMHVCVVTGFSGARARSGTKQQFRRKVEGRAALAVCVWWCTPRCAAGGVLVLAHSSA